MPEFAEIEHRLHRLLTERFDIEGIAAATTESLRRRLVIKDSMQRNGTRWDFVSPSAQEGRYVR